MSKEVAVLGIGMYPWGKYGKNFLEYGMTAITNALKDAGLEKKDIQFIVGGETVRCGYPGYVAGQSFARMYGFSGIPALTCYGACATGGFALYIARNQILSGNCDVALVVGADSTPKGFFGPNAGERPEDPDWLRFRLLGATNPSYWAMHALRRKELYGTTDEDLAMVKVKNSRHGLHNPYARYRKEVTVEEVLNSPMVSDPLRLLEICATSDGAAAVIISSMEYAKKVTSKPVAISAISTLIPDFPNLSIDNPYLATDSSYSAKPSYYYKQKIPAQAYEEAAITPADLDLAEVYDLCVSMELEWYEDIGLCKRGEAERLLKDGETMIGGRIPVNPSGGLCCFGEAIPAQALAQICELTTQLRGNAGVRQIEGAKAGLAINRGMFGHCSCAVLKK